MQFNEANEEEVERFEIFHENISHTVTKHLHRVISSTTGTSFQGDPKYW